MEKRVLLAVILSTLVLIAFRYYMMVRYPPPEQEPARQQAALTQPVAPEQEVQPPAPATSSIKAAALEEKKVTIDSDLYRAALSNRGAVITSWQLKKYKDESGGNFEIIPQFLPADQGSFFRFATGEAQLDAELNSAVFEIRDEPREADLMSAPASLTFVYARPGLSAEKRFVFEEKKYLVSVEVKLLVDGRERAASLAVGPAIGAHPSFEDARAQPHAVVTTNGDILRIQPDDVAGAAKYSGVKGFAGIETQYFATVFLPEEAREIELEKYIWKSDANQRELINLNFPAARPVQAYVGPKEYEALFAVNPALTDLIDYGIFAFIVKALLFSLKFIYKYVHNYGTAIIILTFFISLLLFPFRYKQMVSMKKLQKVQPRIKAIQEKYQRLKQKDPDWQKKMNMEVIEVYREHGANPLGGCLPLLLQMPILFAFYNLLAYSIELRNAPFFLWIRDLSEKDPYYVTPILMGATMLLSQKMTTAPTTDPAQNKLLFWMPVIFTFMFLNLSAGLNLYFLFSNIFAIGLQLLSEKIAPPEPEPAPARR